MTLPSSLSGNVGSSYVVTKDEVSATEDKDFFINGGMTYMLDRRLSASFGLQYAKKDSDAVPDRGYDEARVFAGVGYLLGNR